MIRFRVTKLAFSTAFLTLMVPATISAQNFLPFQKKVAADPNTTYTLTQQDGPWLIHVTSFAGDAAKKRANELVLELRKDFKLKAFVHQTTIDLSERVEGITWNKKKTGHEATGVLERKKMRNLNGGKFEEVSVVVGNFHSVHDPNAVKTLDRVKKVTPEAYNLADTRRTNQFIGAMRQIVNLNNEDKAKQGPFRAAFMIPNPTLPEDFFTGDGVDHFILNINKKAKYSLLDCPKPYSVRVATFRGDVSFNLHEIEAKKKEFSLKRVLGGGVKSKLAIAAEKASKLTEVLRKQYNVEAYEFHDRHESYVCVGSFDWVGKPRADGKQEINPYVLKVIETYKAYDANIPGLSGLLQPRSLPNLKGITFDMQPIGVKVPQISTVNRIMRQDTNR